MLNLSLLLIVFVVILVADAGYYTWKKRRAAERSRSMAAHPAGKGLTPGP